MCELAEKILICMVYVMMSIIAGEVTDNLCEHCILYYVH